MTKARPKCYCATERGRLGDFDGPAVDGTSCRDRFTGKYSHRIPEDIGHNVPQEAPQAFAQAIVDVDRY